jgi:hypothetical protein
LNTVGSRIPFACGRRDYATHPPLSPPPLKQPSPSLYNNSNPEDDDIDLPALIAGPTWSFPLTEGELGEVVTVLQRLRGAVAALDGQGQWLPAGPERPASRAKVRGAG